MCSSWKYWGAFSAINFAGGAMVWLGAANNAGVYLIGLLLLLPGSAIAAFLPFGALWRPFLWRCCETDVEGLSNVLYVPAAVLANLLAWWLYRIYRSRKATRANTLNSSAAAGEEKTES